MTKTGRPLKANAAIREFALMRLQQVSSRKVVEEIKAKYGVKVCFNTVLNWKKISPERRALDLERLIALAPKVKRLLKDYTHSEIITILRILTTEDKDAEIPRY